MRQRNIVRFSGLAMLAGLATLPTTGLALDPISQLLVPGKEYSNLIDKNAAGAPAAGQIVFWTGTGSATDTVVLPGGEVDALANSGDAFFFEVVNNNAALLISVQGDAPGVPIQAENELGTISTWATKTEVNGAPGTLDDLDGLEVYGPDPGTDANRYSLFGDAGGVAVWDDLGNPIVSTADIAALTGLVDYREFLDVDALMMNGDWIMFSLRPILSAGIDGGEIWVGNLSTGASGFLFHGGHFWDTAFDVGLATGCLNENIDALEAVQLVPEPASLTAMALGAAALLRRRAKKA